MNTLNQLTINSILPVGHSNLTIGKTFIGIDFGTSTTVVSIASYDSQQNLIHTDSLRLQQVLSDGTIYTSEIVPSVIAWLDNHILVGEGASELKYQLKFGKNIWYSFKMDLGEDLGAKYYDSELRNTEPFYIKNPKDAARVFFAFLKFLIDRYCKEFNLSGEVSYAVSIPASFEANQRKDLLEALAANDMNVSKQALIDEPNAAFISYVVSRAEEGNPIYINPQYNSKVLVFDFGGGTCDISILEIGQNANGFFSKNIAISKFAKLGGDDIDRYLTYHYLLPRFLQANGKKKENFRTNERKQIASALYKVAERLKIMKNKTLANLTSDFIMPGIKNSDVKTEIEYNVSVATSKGILSQNSFYLTNKELTETMNVFLKQGFSKTTRIKGEDEYYSVYSSIDNAIKKSHTPKEEIDYILFIGGSSQSPYIQEALKKYFEDSEMLVPINLRTHVSKGAAIHSLIFNGMNKCLIQPISSEPILIITKDDQPKIILPAGTQIPCGKIVIDDLVTSREGQNVIELPICVGNTTKLLFNLKIKSLSTKGFPLNTSIKLTFEVNADKLLLISASCAGSECSVEPLSPFANKELSTEERIALKAERQANLESEQNGGVPSKDTLIALRSAYTNAGYDFKAAETYELQKELYPASVDLNYLGVLYHNSGNHEKAAEFFEQEIQNNPNNAHAHFNLGNTMKYIDKDVYKKHIRKACELNPDYDIALIEAGRLDREEGDREEGYRKLRRAYDNLLKQWKTNSLRDKASLGWLASVAHELGELDVEQKVQASIPNLESKAYYDKENLSRVRINMLTTKI